MKHCFVRSSNKARELAFADMRKERIYPDVLFNRAKLLKEFKEDLFLFSLEEIYQKEFSC